MSGTEGPPPLSPVPALLIPFPVPVPVPVPAPPPALLHDPDTWVGAVFGACAVLGVIALLQVIRGRVLGWAPSSPCSTCFTPIHKARKSFRRRSSSRRPSDYPGEITWYECIEEGVDEILAAATVPLMTGQDRIINPANIRLTQLCGQSCPRIEKEDREEGESRTSWSPGNASELSVRCGPDYVRQGRKEPSLPALYVCAGCDVVRAGCRIENPLPRLGPLPAGGAGWHKGLGIPRVVTINGQLPFEEGPKLYGEHPPEDVGSSLIASFVVSDEVIRVASLELQAKEAGTDPPDVSDEPLLPAVRLLRDLLARGTMELPEGQKAGFRTSGALKVIGFIEEFDQVEVPRLLRPALEKNNGKPALLTNFAHMFRDESGACEWMCIDFDVRKMTWLSRSMLVKLRHRFKEVSFHEAFVIQGTQDDELPEVVLASARFHGLDVLNTAWIDDPAAPPGSAAPDFV